MLFICDVKVNQKTYMENESSILLGGTTILLALFVKITYTGKHILSQSFHTVSHITKLKNNDVTRVERKTAELWGINSIVQKTAQNSKKAQMETTHFRSSGCLLFRPNEFSQPSKLGIVIFFFFLENFYCVLILMHLNYCQKGTRYFDFIY